MPLNFALFVRCPHTYTLTYFAALLTFKDYVCVCGWLFGSFGRPNNIEIVCFWLLGFLVCRFWLGILSLCLCCFVPSLLPFPTHHISLAQFCSYSGSGKSVKLSVTFRYDILCSVIYVLMLLLF